LGTGEQDQWQGIAAGAIRVANVVILVPHQSEGVSWEVDRLVAEGRLTKTVFLMPPLANDFDVPAMWTEATAMMVSRGLTLPAYDPAGLIFQLGPEGGITESWPFEVVWTGTLINRLDHLLPHERHDGSSRGDPEAAVPRCD
jgi:hypothetical protein